MCKMRISTDTDLIEQNLLNHLWFLINVITVDSVFSGTAISGFSSL